MKHLPKPKTRYVFYSKFRLTFCCCLFSFLGVYIANASTNENVLKSNFLINQQKLMVKGMVTDEDGSPLPAVNITVEGTSEGTTTDFDGNFEIEVEEGRNLLFSSVGFSDQTVKVEDEEELEIQMKQGDQLDEVVVIGYGKQKEKNITGSISSVSSDDFKSKHPTNISEALQGSAPGIDISPESGQPGGGSSIRIRGATSINNSDPLYVVDGNPVDNISFIDPADIESMHVLKDGASAAIYGTRASSGVILVETKEGTNQKTQVNYNGYYGFQQAERKLNLLDAKDYVMLRNEARENDGKDPLFEDPSSYGKGTNWQKEIFDNTAKVQNHQINISGGNDEAKFYTSFGIYDQEGIVTPEINNYSRITARLRSTFNPTDWLEIGENFNYEYGKTKGNLDPNGNAGSPLSSAIHLDPLTPVVETDPDALEEPPYAGLEHNILNPDGYPYGISTLVQQEFSNPRAYIETQRGNHDWRHNIVGDVHVAIKPTENIELKSLLGGKQAFWGNESFRPLYFLGTANTNTGTNEYSRSAHKNLRWHWDNTINYSESFGDHDLDVLLGFSVENNNKDGLNGTYQGIPVDNFYQASMNYDLPEDQRLFSGDEDQPYRLVSYFGRANYSYKDKYLFTGVLRVDGSSKFGINNKFGKFPAFSAGWVPTEEEFWPTNDVLDHLKLKVSYGVNGNDRSLGSYQYVSTLVGGQAYVLGDGNYINGYAPDVPANPDLVWEETKQFDAGFEAVLFEDLTVNFDYYKKNTKDMLRQVSLPSYSGVFGDPYQNIASMTNEGFELGLDYNANIGDVDFTVKANASYNENNVTDIGLQNHIDNAGVAHMNGTVTRTEVGQAYQSFYGYVTDGIFQTQDEVNNYVNDDGEKIQPNAQPGDIRFVDKNGDGKISDKDRDFLGNAIPTWNYGISVGANWNNFDLNINTNGQAGGKVFNGLRRVEVGDANYTDKWLGRWTGEGSTNSRPRLTDDDPNRNYENPSDFYLEKVDFLRIQSAQIGYTFPEHMTESIGVTNLRVYLAGKNLYTFTKYDGFNPEIGGGSQGIDMGVYPLSRTYMLGLNITL